METTDDALLSGKVRLRQPRHGYRAAVDSVVLAAAVATQPGQRVLELGCGAGAALLCLAARIPGLALTGIEIQQDYADLARWNAAANGAGAQIEIVQGDARSLPDSIPRDAFDHVLCNPPFHDAAAYDAGPDAGKNLAQSMTTQDLTDWIKAAHGRLRRRGVLTMIHRADGLPHVLAALGGGYGGIALMPLWPKAGAAARRILIRAVRDSRAPLCLLPGLVLHNETGSYTADTQRILTDAVGMDW